MDGHYPNTSHFKRSKLFTDISIRQARKVSNELSKGFDGLQLELVEDFPHSYTRCPDEGRPHDM
jgi:hypothetical protein